MIPDWMIDAIEKQEQAQEPERPRMEIPVPPQDWRPFPEKEEAPQRGVVTFDILGD